MRQTFTVPSGKLLLVIDGVVIDDATGEVKPELTPTDLRDSGGVIAGRNLYPILSEWVNRAVAADPGFSARINPQFQRTADRVGGVIYFSAITYRGAKRSRRVNGRRIYSRERGVKWTVLNLELFSESSDIRGAAKSILTVCANRGIAPRHSPGSIGSALLRASPEWGQLRRPAPRFISQHARDHLPGNYYAIRPGYKKARRAYYVDQRSAHHTIAATTPMPHPHFLRARGRFRGVEDGRMPECYSSADILERHIGLVIATVTCRAIHPDHIHLYPEWMRNHGRHVRWIWTPELRLLGDTVTVEHISAALTSIRPDPALAEYARWCLDQLSLQYDPSVKPALLAAYGMLAVRSDDDVSLYTSHGREPAERSVKVSLPLVDTVYRSTVKRRRTPSIQNVIARGVIESEVRTRSIEYARRLEHEGVPVVHIYADGVIAACDQLPFIPEGWRVASELTDVYSPAPHSVVSREMVRLPGIPNGRRTAYMRRDLPGEQPVGERPSMHLRENEPLAFAS